MKVLSFGSFNIDHTYSVDHFVSPGETESVLSYKKTLGGKGFNQTIALIKAGAAVLPAGCIGEDGQEFKDVLTSYHQTTTLVKTCASATGHAIIQVADSENNILIFGGANQCITDALIDEAISYMDPGDYLLIQNEINHLPALIEKAHKRKMKVIFNMAPMNEAIRVLSLQADVINVNEVEAAQLLGISSTAKEDLIRAFKKYYPDKEILLTLGEAGSVYLFEDMLIEVPAFKVKAIDTTAAGDTYIGYYLAAIMDHKTIKEAMTIASRASSLTVTKAGSSVSIPTRKEVLETIIRDLYRDIPLFKGKVVTYKKGLYNRDIPVFDEETKKFVYALYHSGLLALDDEAADDHDLSQGDLIDSVKHLVHCIRLGHLDKRELAKRITDGTVQKLDAHIRTLL